MNRTQLMIAEEICEIGKRLYLRGMVAANDGNISCRLSDGCFMVTPTGVSKGYMSVEDMCILNANGEWISGAKPTSESKMHLAIFRERSDISCCVHAHPKCITAFSCTKTPFDASALPEAVLGLGKVITAPYAAPSTLELAKNAAEAARQTEVIILSRHGAITLGKTPTDALFKMESLEHCAHTLIYAKLLGVPTALSQTEQDQLRHISETVYKN